LRLTLLTAAALALPLAVQAQEVPADTVARINELLAGMNCQMDPSDIEVEDGAYELDDVMCADGQYDIDLDENFEVTNRRKE
jgi:hypothetical protein